MNIEDKIAVVKAATLAEAVDDARRRVENGFWSHAFVRKASAGYFIVSEISKAEKRRRRHEAKLMRTARFMRRFD